MRKTILGVLVAGLLLTGCGRHMSKAEACELMARMDGEAASTSARAAILGDLMGEAPAPLSSYLKERSAWLLAGDLERDPQVDSYAEAQQIIAERNGFDRGIYCSGS